MNISGGNLPTMPGAGQGAEVLTAALSKKQQQADGAAAPGIVGRFPPDIFITHT
jgi:hypothetical protein